jgi:hypothetical protein
VCGRRCAREGAETLAVCGRRCATEGANAAEEVQFGRVLPAYCDTFAETPASQLCPRSPSVIEGTAKW